MYASPYFAMGNDPARNARHHASASEVLLRLPPRSAPEDRLMLAVLLDAVALLREHATGVNEHGPRLVADTARWVASADVAWPLSFVNLCRALGLDPDGFRAALRNELAELGAPGLLATPRARVVPMPSARAQSAAAPAARRRAGRARRQEAH